MSSENALLHFFRKETGKFAGEHKLPVIGQSHSEVLDIPIYKYENGENPLCITMPFSTAPGAAGTIEELHAMGCETFVVCGAAGALTQGSTLGEIILPNFGHTGRGNIISLHCPFTGNLVS